MTNEDKKVMEEYLERVKSYGENQAGTDSGYSVRQFFDEYAVWYEKMYGCALSEKLNPKASNEELEMLEKAAGYLDKDVRELYSICNGENEEGFGAFFGFKMLSISELVSKLENVHREQDDENDVESADGKVRANTYNYGWLPLFSDCGGNYIGVDYNPTEAGTVGQVINYGRDENTQYVFAPSLSGFMKYMMELTKNEGMFESEEMECDIYEVVFINDGVEYYHLADFLKSLK